MKKNRVSRKRIKERQGRHRKRGKEKKQTRAISGIGLRQSRKTMAVSDYVSEVGFATQGAMAKVHKIYEE